MTNDENFAPYSSKTAKQNAEKHKNNLRRLYLKLRSQNDDTECQISVAQKLKTDLHLKRLVDNFALSKATMAEIVEEIGKLMLLNEPNDSDAMQEYNTCDESFKELRTKVSEAETEIGEAMAQALQQQPPQQLRQLLRGQT